MSLSVIIPSRNADNLEPCVHAIRSAGEQCRIIVVDDGLTRRPEGCEYIAGVKPFIFARNANAGIMEAYPDDVLLLNDDALLQTPGGFSLLQREAKAHPKIGVISTAVNNVGNMNQHQQHIGLRLDPRMVCFHAVFIPRSTIKVVGLLDEQFTAYGFEDDDYCLRVRSGGLQIGIHDGCYVTHDSLPSTFRGNPRSGGDLTAGRRIFIQKWGRYPL